MSAPPEDGIYGMTTIAPEDLEVLQSIERRVLWLSTYMIHYANKIRPNPDGLKVGGHQASSASVVSLATALYFRFLRPQDHVAFKPHASPVFHAIQYLLGRLPREKLQTLREFGGLQAYPSRVKDPDGVTITTGSVGLGAGATIFGALAQQYVEHHFGRSPRGRYIALVGDAEIDEGNVPEALGEARVYELDNLWWIIDFNRQSLDYIAPEGRALEIRKLFEAKGWHVILLKYGSRQEAFFKQPHGDRLRDWIDECPNVEYQSLCRADGAHIREVIVNWHGKRDAELARLLDALSDDEVKALALNLGGHDLPRILEAFHAAERIKGQPVAILAYTIKGWGLPIAGHFENHAAQLAHEQIEVLQRSLGIPAGDEWEGFPPDSREGRWIQGLLAQWQAARADGARPVPALQVPALLQTSFRPQMSTQEALGRILVELSRVPGVAERTLTISPDVAVSTNLGGWISKMGVYAPEDRPNYWALHNIQTLVRWRQSRQGHHIELGIAEHNFYLALAMFGLSHEFNGEVLFPIGTIYDPFVARGLDALIYGVYSGAKFIFAGTPSGITLCREGGAHQSIVTPLVGLGLPNLIYFEPAYGWELECILCWGLQQLLDRQHGKSLYVRLSTRRVEQVRLEPTPERRRQVLAGGYWLRDYRGEPDYRQKTRVHLFATGVMVPEALRASDLLREDEVYANVINVTSPDRLFADWFEAQRDGAGAYLDELMPPEERGVPAVSVIDGHPLTLGWLGGALGSPLIPLGVVQFGESGGIAALYRKHRIDVEAMLEAVARLLVRRQPAEDGHALR
jgi:pyruvate dehydrogenase E1 component